MVTLESEKKRLLATLKEESEQAFDRPVVDTGLGFSVDGGYFDLINFENGKALGVPYIVDVDYNQHTATNEVYDAVIQAIRVNALLQFQKKWEVKTQIIALQQLLLQIRLIRRLYVLLRL